MIEGQQQDKKSLRAIDGNRADWFELGRDCVGFANSHGGKLLIGIEDDHTEPPPAQVILDQSIDSIRKRIPQITTNVGIEAQRKTASNGGEYIEILVLPCRQTVASTTDGRYFVRVGDATCPVMPEDLLRFAAEKSAYSWETAVSRKVSRREIDQHKLSTFKASIAASRRVSTFIKAKNDEELLDYYQFADGEWLTNLGVLWIGQRKDRARVLYAPSVQFIRYDENGVKISKRMWDDFSKNPQELIADIWCMEVWKEGEEVSEGLFRKMVPRFDGDVIRELIANALVHRPYTTRGDIFINLHPDRVEIHNPGRLPLGVTPRNILHTSVKRNIHLAKVFYDLELMEQEGSGYDKIYETLALSAKKPPLVEEGPDRVCVTVGSRILNRDVLRFMESVSKQYDLRQKECIALGLLAQQGSLTALEFSTILELEDQQERLRDWVGRLLDWGIVTAKGRTRATEYRVDLTILETHPYNGPTTLKAIEPHRLRELFLEDVRRHPGSSISDIHARIGNEIPLRKVRAIKDDLLSGEYIVQEGVKRWARYSINGKMKNGL
jgi:ATP-dependent DNA helicase RecG